MNVFIRLFAISTLLIVSACKKDENAVIEPSRSAVQSTANITLLGTWIRPVTVSNGVKLERSATLLDGEYGISFEPNNALIVRHSGWCGTPPYTFSDANGTWKQDSIGVYYEVNFGQGISDVEWKIVSLTQNTLIVQ